MHEVTASIEFHEPVDNPGDAFGIAQLAVSI